MGTQRQIESAHINGAKSRGPKTLEGKRRSSANARKHGLASKNISSDADTLAAVNAAVARYMADLCPASPRELFLVQQMAICKIRQRQAWAAETEAWNRALAAHDGCLATAAETLAESGEWACIMRYETRFNRQYYSALEGFLTARKLRLRNEPEPPALTSFCDTILRNEPDPSTPRNVILPNEPDPGASTPCPETILPNEPEPSASIPVPRRDLAKRTGMVPVHRTTNEQRRTTNAPPILRNEPDSAPADPPLRSDFAKRTGSIAVPSRRRCSHHCFLQTEPAPRRPIRQFARDKIPRSPD